MSRFLSFWTLLMARMFTSDEQTPALVHSHPTAANWCALAVTGWLADPSMCVLLQNVFPLFPCNWLAILFPKLYHSRRPVRLPRLRSCGLNLHASHVEDDSDVPCCIVIKCMDAALTALLSNEWMFAPYSFVINIPCRRPMMSPAPRRGPSPLAAPALAR